VPSNLWAPVPLFAPNPVASMEFGFFEYRYFASGICLGTEWRSKVSR
jgi:hypothetical protein